MSTAPDRLEYLAGFGNTFATEAVAGVLPRDQSSPRELPYGLYAEQINGTGFTVERRRNRRSWLYRLRPQISARAFERVSHDWLAEDFSDGIPSPEPMRFKPLGRATGERDWLAGLTTFAGVGEPGLKRGLAVHLYLANRDMERVLCDVDGDLVVVPEQGRLRLQTELGWLEVAPGEIAVLPCGIRFRVSLPDGSARGFVAELFDGHMELPERGPVGANGLADERHFLHPVAAYEDVERDTTIVVKQGGQLHATVVPHSPFDVVAWHGTYAPYKYDLARFNSYGSVSFDHPDPSILTVLTCPADAYGASALDVVVFRRRWDVSEDTFRPPYFHRNAAVELNMVVQAKGTTGPWQSGAFSYTPLLTPHGISAASVRQARAQPAAEANRPALISGESTWVQFESTYQLRVMPWMIDHQDRDADYLASFAGYPEHTLSR